MYTTTLVLAEKTIDGDMDAILPQVQTFAIDDYVMQKNFISVAHLFTPTPKIGKLHERELKQLYTLIHNAVELILIESISSKL